MTLIQITHKLRQEIADDIRSTHCCNDDPLGYCTACGDAYPCPSVVMAKSYQEMWSRYLALDEVAAKSYKEILRCRGLINKLYGEEMMDVGQECADEFYPFEGGG